MNARNQTDLALIDKGTSIAREILGDLLEMGEWPVPLAVSTFNDDDVYIYDAASKQLIKHLPCSDQQVKDAKYIGLRVMAGQTWAKGMTAKTLSLWKSA